MCSRLRFLPVMGVDIGVGVGVVDVVFESGWPFVAASGGGGGGCVGIAGGFGGGSCVVIGAGGMCGFGAGIAGGIGYGRAIGVDDIVRMQRACLMEDFMSAQDTWGGQECCFSNYVNNLRSCLSICVQSAKFVSIFPFTS